MGASHMGCSMFILGQGQQPLALAAVTGWCPHPFIRCFLLRVHCNTMDGSKPISCFLCALSPSCLWWAPVACSDKMVIISVAAHCCCCRQLPVKLELQLGTLIWCAPTKQQGKNVQAAFEHNETCCSALMLHADGSMTDILHETNASPKWAACE